MSSSRIVRSPVSVPKKETEPNPAQTGESRKKAQLLLKKKTKGGFESHKGSDPLLGNRVAKKPTTSIQQGKKKGTPSTSNTTKRTYSPKKSSDTASVSKKTQRSKSTNTLSSASKHAKSTPTTSKKESIKKNSAAQQMNKGSASDGKKVPQQVSSKKSSTPKASTSSSTPAGSLSSKQSISVPLQANQATPSTATLTPKEEGQPLLSGSTVLGLHAQSKKEHVKGEGTQKEAPLQSALQEQGPMQSSKKKLGQDASLLGSQKAPTWDSMGTMKKGAASAYQKKEAHLSMQTSERSLEPSVTSSTFTQQKDASLHSTKPLSVRSLHLQELGDTAIDSQEQLEHPRQEFRALLKQWAGAKEAVILEQLQWASPLDASFVAQKIASLAQSGQLPVTALLTTITKLLKRAGNQRKLAKLKSALVKKGVISSSISTEALELIAAMIALYLAKTGNATAEELLVDVFRSSSRDLVLPDEGGSQHEEGREEERHARHQRGEMSAETEDP